MYKAIQAYRGEQNHILSFSAGDTLCILEKSNETWWLASDSHGKVGYVPTTYVKKDHEDSTDIVLQSVNNAIGEILASAPDGSYSPKQEALLRKLIAHKESIISSGNTTHANHAKTTHHSPSKRRAPPPPPQASSSSSAVSHVTTATKTHHAKHHAPPLPVRATSLKKEVGNIKEQEREHTPPTQPHPQTENMPPTHPHPQHVIPHELGSELIKLLQDSLDVSESKSRDALNFVLHTIGHRVPTLENVMNDITATIPELNRDEEADKLGLALANLKEIKDDAQQRNWAIEDDEEKIAAILNEILAELNSLDKQCAIKLLSKEQHDALHTLVDYHQMETRVSLRLIILQILGVICSTSKNLVSALLTTVLPLELSMDLVNHTQDAQRTCYSALVLTMLFSTAEPVPFGHYGRLNKEFVEYLINYIEDELPDSEQNDQVVDMFVNVLLSFNLHFVAPSDNFIMQVISDRGTCTLLSEKIMMLVNRADDPVIMEEHWEKSNEGRPPPSVLKFLQDIFSQRATSSFLYTNDMNVLLDIITRNLTDLSSGDKIRTEYLDLLLNILMNTNYAENRHRAADIGPSLHRISQEEEEGSPEEIRSLEFDKRIVEKILVNFGHFFT